MRTIREARQDDIPSLALLRSQSWGTPVEWEARISGYFAGTSNPRHALAARIIYVAAEEPEILGFVAGHLTRRYDCEGELQWIDVLAGRRREGIGEGLVTELAKWFVVQRAHRVCVDVDPSNEGARKFYAACGALPLRPSWMYWPEVGKVFERE